MDKPRVANGSKALLAILVSVIGAGIIGMVSVVDKHARQHEQLPGHPQVVECVRNLEADVAEIKADVKELLRRKP